MKIYTRTGDDGETGLFGGARVTKDDPRVEAYGTLDEASAAIGVARAASLPATVDSVLAEVQDDLFTLSAELACAPGKEANLGVRRLEASDVERLERAIDFAEAALPPLTSFIVPGGTSGAAALHLARAVTRRAERRLVSAAVTTAVRHELLVYVNRLSDLLFVLARRANHDSGVADVAWSPRR